MGRYDEKTGFLKEVTPRLGFEGRVRVCQPISGEHRVVEGIFGRRNSLCKGMMRVRHCMVCLRYSKYLVIAAIRG